VAALLGHPEEPSHANRINTKGESMNLQRVVAMVFLFLLTPVVFAEEAPSFAGKWTGPWKNTLGESGTSQLALAEAADGKLSGTWDDVKVTGKRVSKNIIELHGKTDQRSYRMLATLDGDTMTFLYVCASKVAKEGGTYSGEVSLKPAKK
jgi:hypothetical protein